MVSRINSGLMSSNNGEWETPQAFFDRLDAEFGFNLDAAASPENAKCDVYCTKEDDTFDFCWSGTVWLNPPYGREIIRFVEKAYIESVTGATVVVLVPARTDTRWWHDYVMKADEIRLVRGRLRFVGALSSAPFPSAVAIFRPRTIAEMDRMPRLGVMDALAPSPDVAERRKGAGR